jgi:hypothetical protein
MRYGMIVYISMCRIYTCVTRVYISVYIGNSENTRRINANRYCLIKYSSSIALIVRRSMSEASSGFVVEP